MVQVDEGNDNVPGLQLIVCRWNANKAFALPELNVDGFREGSAINFAKQLQGNLLLVHGTADDNCHYQTPEMLIDELIAHNKQFTMFAYPNRTHSIRERKNTTRHLRDMMTNFLLEKMPPNE